MFSSIGAPPAETSLDPPLSLLEDCAPAHTEAVCPRRLWFHAAGVVVIEYFEGGRFDKIEGKMSWQIPSLAWQNILSNVFSVVPRQLCWESLEYSGS